MSPPNLANGSNLIKGTSLIASLTVVSRILGFLRDLVFAAVFGAGIIADAFVIAFRIPNLLRSFLAEGALTSAFVPVFSSVNADSSEQAKELFRHMFGLLLLIASIITLLGIYFADYIIIYSAPGFLHSSTFETCVSLTRIMFPYLIFISIIALINGALNSLAIYGSGAWGQIVMNCVLVLGALIAWPFEKNIGIHILAWSVIFGGLSQIIFQFKALKKADLTLLPKFPLITKHTKEILFLMLPAIFGASMYQLGILLNTILASLLPSGSVSWLFYADRLSQLPIGIFTVALGSTLLPLLSKSYQEKNFTEFSNSLNNSLRYSSFILLPLATFLYLLAEPICQILFLRGEFKEIDAIQTSMALKATAFGIWGYGSSYMLMRALIAKKDTLTPTVIGLINLVLTLIISLALMGKINFYDNLVVNFLVNIQNYIYFADLNHLALALSAGLANTITLPILFLLVEIKTKIKFSLWPFLKVSYLLLLVAVILERFDSLFLTSFTNAFHFPTILNLILKSFIFLIITLLTSRIFRLSELEETFSLFSRIINRKK
jgi:putative peptidoglycan lipid II flippase